MAKKASHHGESEKEGKAWGRGEFAGMPQEKHFDLYPKAHEYGPTDLNDTIGHVDEVNSRAHTKARSHMSNQH